MSAPSTSGLDSLPDSVPADARDEISRFLPHLPPATSCIATGSLVEGIGNANSDIDLYILQDSRQAEAKPISIGMRRFRYLDCEYMSHEGVDGLAAKFQDPSTSAVIEFKQRDFNRYYRLAIGAPLVLTQDVAELLTRFSKEQACRHFGQWSLLRAYQHLARATVSHALGDARRARLLLREAARWRASSVLAAAGEGYPSLKWTTVKAARRFGADTPAYRDCLAGYLDNSGDLGRDLAHLRERIRLPEESRRAAGAERWALNDDVRMVSASEGHYLLHGKQSIVRLSGIASLLAAEMGRGRRWDDAVASVATELSVPVHEVLAAASPYMRELGRSGYLVADADEEP
ncbi:MAG: hypothetical protein ACRD2C_23780 [Acidimicrobiales bacterium]